MPNANPAPKFILESLRPDDNVRGLSGGHADFQPLKSFFEGHAKRYEQCSLARTYVVREDGLPKIIAYMTLVCGEIEAQDGAGLAPDGNPYPYESYPAIKIARLLVDSRHRKKGIGDGLVKFALGTAKDEVCPVVGCRFIVVDAKTASVDFYTKQGFTLLDTPLNRARREPVMFIDLHRAATAALAG